MKEKNISFDLEKKLWIICNNYFEERFRNNTFKKKKIFKIAFIKFMTIKLQNSENFINLLINNHKSNNKIVFNNRDIYEIAKFQFKNKNIILSKFRNIFKFFQFRLISFILSF